MGNTLTYNLPGYGFSECTLFQNSEQFYSLFDEQGIIKKTQEICQLGTMKYVYPGAHHTRYEYIFTQLMLINSVVTNKGKIRNIELSLGSCLKEFKNISKITGGDIMQCIAILGNCGFMYDTFTSDMIIMRLLQTSQRGNKEFYSMYRRNLPSEIRPSFDRIVLEGNYYKLHLFHMIHILIGLRIQKNRENLCNLGINILSKYIDSSLIKNEATKRIIQLYKQIRKVAYLSVDMIYTPAAFGVNLSRMIYSLPTYVDELFDEESPINQTLKQLEGIIHTQIYDSAKCILNSTRIAQKKEQEYRAMIEKCRGISDIRGMILEQKREYTSLHSVAAPDVTRGIVRHSEILLEVHSKHQCLLVGELDEQINQYLPGSRIVFGTQITQNLKKTYAAFGLLSEKNIPADIQQVLSIVLRKELYDEGSKRVLIQYAIRSIFEYEDNFNTLSAPEGLSISDCIIIDRGCKKVSRLIKKNFTKENVHDLDMLHEIYSTAEVLEKIEYQGQLMCFVGGIKINKAKCTTYLDELDGFIYFPSKEFETIAVIIEAKNYSRGGAANAALNNLRIQEIT